MSARPRYRPLREKPSGTVYNREGDPYLVFGPYLENTDGERYDRAYIEARWGLLTETPPVVGAVK